jgi:hypothetical protein
MLFGGLRWSKVSFPADRADLRRNSLTIIRTTTMGLIREPKDVDFTIKSEPWTKKELKKFREIMKQQKEKRAKLA